MNDLVIDVTQLVHWQGKLTGIPRVMNELIVRYKAGEQKCVFVVWDCDTRVFYEVNITKSLSTRGEKIAYLLRGDSGKSVVTSSEKSSRDTLFSVGKQGMRVLHKLDAHHVKGSKRAINTIHNLTRKRIMPKKNDTLLVLWGEASDNDYIERLVSLKKNGVRLVQVVYDMLPILAPQYSGHSTASINEYGRKVYPICNLILSISQYTKKDIQNWLKAQKLTVPSVEVIRLGDDFHRTAVKKPKNLDFKKSGLQGNDFLLCVGTIEARKNHTILYYVYKLAAQKNISLPKIVIVGRRGYRTNDIYEIISDDPDTRKAFVFMTNTSDEELAWLYSHCLFSIYPSFYEGWGLPIAESIMQGVPCICSNTSSMPEVAGDLVTYFSPASSEECLGAIQKLLKPGELALAKKRVRQYKPATWDQTFQQVDHFVKELYGKSN